MSRDGAHEATWLLDPRWDDVPSAMPAAFAGAIGLDAGGRFVLLAPHPDDETLGLGATLADLSDAGHDLVVVLLTDGGASHPRCGHVTAPELIARRNDEFTAAVALLAPRARVVRLGFSDGSLPAEADALAAALEGLLEKGDVVLAPLPDDGHTDHDAAGVVAARVVAESQAVDGAHAESAPMRLLHYPVWRWRRSDPDRFPFDRALLLTPSATALHRKERAIGGYTSQTAPLTAFPGGETVVGPADLAPHRRLVETLVVPASDPALYRRIAASTVAEEPSPVARRLEAAACGTPVVALRRGGLAEVVGPGMGILVDDATAEHGEAVVAPGATIAPLPAAALVAADHLVAQALADAVPGALGLDRAAVRRATGLHGADRMTTDYEGLVRGLLDPVPARAVTSAVAVTESRGAELGAAPQPAGARLAPTAAGVP